MEDTVPNGHPCWVDLSTPDVEDADRFYGELFSWKVAVTETSMGDYHIGSVGEREVAGMMTQPAETAGSPAQWTIFFYVDDAEATIAAATNAGGTLRQEPFEIPGGARVAVLADPAGAMFALITGERQPGPYLSRAVGAVGWVELMTREPVGAVSFYDRVFGWQATTEHLPEVDYTSFVLDGEPVAGMVPAPDDLPDEVPNSWSVYFTVDDSPACEQRAVELGGSVVMGSTDTPVGPFAVLADPAGAVFQVMELRA